MNSNFIHNHNTDEKDLNSKLIRTGCQKRSKDMTDGSIIII